MALKGTKMQKPNKPTIPRSQKPASHPPYEQMIKDAIITLKKKTGSSQFAIAKFMEEKHKHLPLCFRKILLSRLKRLVASEKLVKVKGSFKLPPTKSYGPKKKVATPKPKPKPKRDLKAKEIETTNATAKVKPNPKAAVMSKGAFRHTVNIINAMPLIFTKPNSKPQTKPKPKPALKAKEKTTKSTAKAKPKPKAAAKSKDIARHKAILINAMPFIVTKPKTVVKTKPKAKATSKKRPEKDARILRRTSPRKKVIAPKSTTKKATPKEKASTKSVKPKSVKPTLMINGR